MEGESPTLKSDAVMPFESFHSENTFRFTYFGTYLATPNDFGQFYLKIFDTPKNLIGEGMLVQDFKTICQESSSGNSFIFENVTKLKLNYG